MRNIENSCPAPRIRGMSKRKRLYIDASPELHKALELKAVRTGVKVSQMLLTWVNDHITPADLKEASKILSDVQHQKADTGPTTPVSRRAASR